MLRVGVPATFAAEFLSVFPTDVELIPIDENLDHEVELDVWVADPYSNRAMKAYPHLRGVKLALSLMAGWEWMPATVGPRVSICNARGAHNVSTAEWTLTAILSMLKYFPVFHTMQQEGLWKRRFEQPERFANLTGDRRALYPPVMLEELTGKRMLLVGHGAIGQEIERMLEPFRVQLTRVARSARPGVHPVSELDSLLPAADVVVLILPHTPESDKLIGAPQLALLRQGALLVNAARGPIVDTDALVEALQSGRIRAAIDVTDPEPLPAGHPLWSCPNLLITPHVAGSTPEFGPRALAGAAEEIRRYMKGEPLQNLVRPALEA
jgi:phosphoglycerate dehydrogenase-like enzyme